MHHSSKRAQVGLESNEVLMTRILGIVQQNLGLNPHANAAFQEVHTHLKSLNANTTYLYDVLVPLVGRQNDLGYTLE